MSPVTVAEVEDPDTVAVSPPEEVTVYEVIALPPSELGALQLTVACESPGVALTEVGAPGTVAGVTAEDAELAGPSPTELVATTVKV